MNVRRVFSLCSAREHSDFEKREESSLTNASLKHTHKSRKVSNKEIVGN